MKSETVANLKGVAKELSKSLVNTLLVLDQERAGLDEQSNDDYELLRSYSERVSAFLDDVQYVRRELLNESDEVIESETGGNDKTTEHSETPEPDSAFIETHNHGYVQGVDF